MIDSNAGGFWLKKGQGIDTQVQAILCRLWPASNYLLVILLELTVAISCSTSTSQVKMPHPTGGITAAIASTDPSQCICPSGSFRPFNGNVFSAVSRAEYGLGEHGFKHRVQ